MKNKNKMLIIIIIILMLISLVFFSIFFKKDVETENGDEITLPVSNKKTNGVFEIYNTDIKANNGSTKITATVKNISSKRTEEQRINIVLLDKKQNELGRIVTTIPSLESGKATNISVESLKVYENIYDFEIR